MFVGSIAECSWMEEDRVKVMYDCEDECHVSTWQEYSTWLSSKSLTAVLLLRCFVDEMKIHEQLTLFKGSYAENQGGMSAIIRKS